MAQASTITVNDREATPVAHTFAPRAIVPGNALFVESNAVPIGERTLTIRTTKTGNRYHTKLILACPSLVMETINGVSVPKVPRTALVELHARFDDTSTEQERKNAIGMMANALAASQTMLNASLTQLESIW